MDADPADFWFVAVLVYESRIVGATDFEPSVDVQFRLIRAADAEAAHAAALDLGERERTSYLNPAGETCEWRFAGLEDLRRVDDERLEHGTEVYGFTEGGLSADQVLPKNRLIHLRRDRPV